ncbi:hypothetical protein LCGC14_1481610 [marine sediment metagenome]|uniref:Uncharacterized protein n=1 Tax=marine sediment metagenome TaxID=412755 RepID=A0A0F9JVC1_9ZZZZ
MNKAPAVLPSEEEAKGLISAMLDRVKMQALAPTTPKRKRKRDRKHAAKHIVRKRVKEARRRNRR